ncbi:MAG: DUF1559 domain-containing protein [Phycisphaerae bacterium]|jgi:prepilin-type processing-associated H-X9-DG protein/prepilin-type N-terminal cleavage/methylation domain-containing protein
MKGMNVAQTEECVTASAFTLVELLVVISIIAMLIAILAPSLAGVKDLAKAAVCSSNLRNVGLAVNVYSTTYKVFPASYVYPNNPDGSFNLLDQPADHPYGYLHWSYALYNMGQSTNFNAFQCPGITNGGAPRTNPGPQAGDWGDGQVDQNGQSTPNALTDFQAPRVAFAANAALMPRNKFTTALSGGQRINQFVSPDRVGGTSGVILSAEIESWPAMAIQEGGGLLLKSHRPINPFTHVGAGTNEYAAPLNTPGFIYGAAGSTDSGLLSYDQTKEMQGLIDGSAGAEINTVARRHAGGNDKYGGAANFLYCDGHVDRKTVKATLAGREWGDRYYSLTGANQVLP